MIALYPFDTFNNRIILRFPNIHNDTDLPFVSLVTITRNRSEFYPLMIRNVSTCDYPKQLIEWIIIEDGRCCFKEVLSGTSLEASLQRIVYHNLGDLTFPIGYKRNLAVKKASHDIIVHMDDDDYYPPESIIARVRCLRDNDMDIKCVGCLSVRTFHMFTERTYEAYESSAINMSESSLAYKREFWNERRFENHCSRGEGVLFLNDRYTQCRSLPHIFVIVQFDHTKNTVKRQSNDMIYHSENTVPFLETIDKVTFCFVSKLRDDIFHSLPETEELIKFIKSYGSSYKASGNLRKLSSDLQRHPMCLELNRKFPLTNANRNSVVFYCGSGNRMTFLKHWDYDNMDNIGGSEEAVLMLAEIWSKRYKILIYNERNDVKTFHNGCVTFLPWYQFRQLDPCLVFISWRDVTHFEMFPMLNTKRRLLDLHDYTPVSWITSDIRLDNIFVKSEFHADHCVPSSLRSYTIIVENTITPKLRSTVPINQREKIILSTSRPERCWYTLFRLADDITTMFPDVVFMHAYDHSYLQRTEHWSVLGPLYEKNNSVRILGHLSIEDMNSLYKHVRMFVYPTLFREIDCVSLSKAIEASCVCVHTSAGAMIEKKKSYDTYCIDVREKTYEFDALNEEEYESFKTVVIEKIIHWDKDIEHTNTIFPSNHNVASIWMELFSDR